jgi:small subunit ribosomal protein S14
MAKLSIIARDKKKEQLVARYAAKRKALKEAGAADANLPVAQEAT